VPRSRDVNAVAYTEFDSIYQIIKNNLTKTTILRENYRFTSKFITSQRHLKQLKKYCFLGMNEFKGPLTVLDPGKK
jgi:hypothetical protein